MLSIFSALLVVGCSVVVPAPHCGWTNTIQAVAAILRGKLDALAPYVHIQRRYELPKREILIGQGKVGEIHGNAIPTENNLSLLVYWMLAICS